MADPHQFALPFEPPLELLGRDDESMSSRELSMEQLTARVFEEFARRDPERATHGGPVHGAGRGRTDSA